MHYRVLLCSTSLQSSTLLCNSTEFYSALQSSALLCLLYNTIDSAMLCLLYNITEFCFALSTLQQYRVLLCFVCSTILQSSTLFCLLYNITEFCSALSALQSSALLCLLYNITEHTLLFVDHTYSLQQDQISL